MGQEGGPSRLGPLFVGMALLFPWATKEYLLWNMSLGQIIMYYALGMEARYPKATDEKPSQLRYMTREEVKKLREEMRELGLSSKSTEPTKEQLDKKEEFRRKYGDIDG